MQRERERDKFRSNTKFSEIVQVYHGYALFFLLKILLNSIANNLN